MQTDRLKVIRKMVIGLVVVCMALLLFVPMYAFWIPEAYEEGLVVGWNNVRMLEDELYQLAIPPFYFIFPLALLVRQKILKLILKSILFIYGLLLFFLAMMSGILAQDYSAGFGTLILLGLAVLLGIMYLLDWFILERKKEELKTSSNLG